MQEQKDVHLNKTKTIQYIPKIHIVEYKNCHLKDVRFIILRQKVGTGAWGGGHTKQYRTVFF
jgi:hypothetical protein